MYGSNAVPDKEAAAEVKEAQRRADAEKLALQAEEKASAAKKKALEPMLREQEAKIGSLGILKEEIALLQTKATGTEKQVKAAEREAELRKSIRDIVAATGLSEEDARGVAESKLKLQDQIAGKGSRIKGFTGDVTSRISKMGAVMDRNAEGPGYRGGFATGALGHQLSNSLGLGWQRTGFGTNTGPLGALSSAARAAAMKEGNARRSAERERNGPQDPMAHISRLLEEQNGYLKALASGI